MNFVNESMMATILDENIGHLFRKKQLRVTMYDKKMVERLQINTHFTAHVSLLSI